MFLLSRFFYKRPPDGLLEFFDRVYDFDSCFCTEVLPDEMYQLYLHEIVTKLHEELLLWIIQNSMGVVLFCKILLFNIYFVFVRIGFHLVIIKT